MRIPSFVTAAVAAAAVISSSSAHATMRLADDPGGLIAAYQHRFDRARATGAVLRAFLGGASFAHSLGKLSKRTVTSVKI